MKILIHPGAVELTPTQREKLEKQLALRLAGFDDWIGSVIVRLSDATALSGYRCALEVVRKPQVLSVEDSDSTIFLAVDHTASRAARSVRRAIENEARR